MRRSMAMGPKPGPAEPASEADIKDLRQRPRKRRLAEEKSGITVEAPRGEDRACEAGWMFEVPPSPNSRSCNRHSTVARLTR